MLDKRPLAVLSLFQLRVDVLDGLAQRPVLDVVHHQLHDLVERELLADQVRADADECHDLTGRGLCLKIQEPALDADDPVPHFLECFLHFPLGKCLLFTADRLLRASLDPVDPGRAGNDMQKFEIALRGELRGLLLRGPGGIGFKNTLYRLPRPRHPLNPELRHPVDPPLYQYRRGCNVVRWRDMDCVSHQTEKGYPPPIDSRCSSTGSPTR